MADARDDLIEELRRELAAARAEIAALKREVAELRQQLGQNPTNSHKPPSSDPPGTRAAKEPTGRRRGGQSGHKPNKRVLLPAESVTRRTVVKPTRVQLLRGKRLSVSGEPALVHQVIDVPEIRPDVHEIRMHAGTCTDCGTKTWASLCRRASPRTCSARDSSR